MKKAFLVISHGLDHPECEKKVVAVCTKKSKAEEIKKRNALHRMIRKVPLNSEIGGIMSKKCPRQSRAFFIF